MKYAATEKDSHESGTGKDAKGVPHKNGRSEHMRSSNHEFGDCHTGKHYHEHHRGKAD